MMFVNYDTIARDYAESRQMLPETRLVQIRQRYTSSLHLIREEQFQVGLKRAEPHTREHPDDPAWQYETVSMLVAEKPARGLGGD